MLQAMNTGHDGSLTRCTRTRRATRSSRIETMVLMAGFDLPVRAIREQIASALRPDRAHRAPVRRLAQGRRASPRCSGMEGDQVTLQDLFVFNVHGVSANGSIDGRAGVDRAAPDIQGAVHPPRHAASLRPLLDGMKRLLLHPHRTDRARASGVGVGRVGRPFAEPGRRVPAPALGGDAAARRRSGRRGRQRERRAGHPAHLRPIANDRLPSEPGAGAGLQPDSMRGEPMEAALDAAATLIAEKPARAEVAAFGYSRESVH